MVESTEEAETEKNVEDKEPEVERRECSQCGDRKELNEDNFGHHAKTKDGWSKVCRECRSITMRKKNEKTNQAIRKGIIGSLRDDDSVIELDFTGREDLLERISSIAKDRLRKPAGQVLWWLINTDFDKLLNGGLTGD